MSKRETDDGRLVFDMWICKCGISNIWMRGQCRRCGYEQHSEDEITEGFTAPIQSSASRMNEK